MRGVVINGELIRERRRNRGMTQEELAHAADCDVRSVRKAEKGVERSDLRIVVGIARALDLEAPELIGEIQESSSDPHGNLTVVRQWVDAFFRADIQTLLDMHTDDTVLEIPGTEDLPVKDYYEGIDEQRVFLTGFFSAFRLIWYDADNTLFHVSGDHVFMRNEALITFLPKGKSYRARHVNEFEFRDGKVAKRVVTADYAKLREILFDD